MPLLAIGGGVSSPASSTGKDVTIPAPVGAANVNLYNFRTLVNDFARNYYFHVVIPEVSENSQVLTMLAKSTILPASSLEDKNFDFQGSQYKMAGHATFDDWTVTFYCDEYQKLRHTFLAWQSVIYDPVRQIPFTAGSYKRSDIKVYQLSKDGNVVTGYNFFGMYPKRVGEIQLDQGSKEISTFSVTFAYDYFVIDTEVAGAESVDDANISKESYSVKIHNGQPYDMIDSLTDFEIQKAYVSDPWQDSEQLSDAAGNKDIEKLSNFKIRKGEISNSSDDKTLLTDAAGNQEIDYNAKGEARSEEGALVSFLQNINPFGRKGDINAVQSPSPPPILDILNWMPLRYSPPIGFRIRKFLPSGINKGIDSVRVPNINPYEWTGLQKPK